MVWPDARRGRAVVRSFFKVNGFYTAGGRPKSWDWNFRPPAENLSQSSGRPDSRSRLDSHEEI